MENKVYGKAYARIVVPQEVLAKASGTISRGVKEILLSEEGDLSFVLTDGQIVLLGNIKGAQGLPGIDGDPGADGFSPTVEIRKTATGHEIIITDKYGTNTFFVPDGTPGKDGYTPQKGIDYFDGKDGEPGKDGKNATPEQIAEAVEDYFEENPVSGDENKFVVTFWVEGANQENVTADKTYAEIDAAYNAGKEVVGLLNGKANAEFKLSIFNIFGYTFSFIDPSTDSDGNCSVAVYEFYYNMNGIIKFAMGSAYIPTKTSDLTNDSGFITLNDIPESGGGEVTAESIKTALGYVPADEADIPTKSEDVGAEKSGAVAAHNVAADSHNDIRVALGDLKGEVEAFLDIDEPTFDQLSELIAKIQANAGSIEQLTNGKVNVTDIINNLTTNAANKPLSAAQGVVLKGLIDSIDTLATGAKNTANEAKTIAEEAKTIVDGQDAFINNTYQIASEAKATAGTASANAGEAKTTANNASNKVNDLESRMNSGEFKGADGAAGKDGTNGADGFSPTVAISDIANGKRISITDKNGTKTADILNGTNGINGTNGTSVTVSNVSESTASGGTNVVTFSDGKKLNVKNGINGANGTNGKDYSDNIEILLPSEVVVVVGVEFNIYYKSIIRANRPLNNYEIKCSLNNTSIGYKLFEECFRLTATEANIGDYTFTMQIKDITSGNVLASKTATLHIIKNRSLNTKNVLYLGDSLTYSRGGLYPAEIQYNLSGGKLISIGSQTGAQANNEIGEVKHEGYNGATVGGFLSEKVVGSFVNPFYNPTTKTFDLAYFMTNQGYSQLDAVCLNLGHNNIGNHVAAVSDLTTLAEKIHAYNADVPVIISLIEPLANQDGWTAKTKNTAEEMRRHWKNLINAYITAFDNGKINNVYLSAPYLNIDVDNDFPTETVARSARDNTQIVRQNDAMHPNRIGTLKMADAYFANLLYRIPEDDAIYYTITNNLTNVSTNNNVGSVKEGTSYTATLTPTSGYVFDTVSVTMGGQAVSVTNGVINIASVTGDIVITANAVEYVASYTNLAKPSTANDNAPNTALTADEWLNGYYISSKKIAAKESLVVTNKIPLTLNDTIRIKGFTVTGTIGGNSCASRFRVLPCDASGNALITEIYPEVTQATQTTGYKDFMDATELEKGIYSFCPNNVYASSYWENVAFVRICGYPIDGNNSNVIVTVNEPIE